MRAKPATRPRSHSTCASTLGAGNALNGKGGAVGLSPARVHQLLHAPDAQAGDGCLMPAERRAFLLDPTVDAFERGNIVPLDGEGSPAEIWTTITATLGEIQSTPAAEI